MIRPRGDPQRLRLGAKWFQAAAARVEQLGLDLRRHSEAASEVWLGWASFRFHDAMAWAENDCAEAVTAFLAAGAALRRYADALQAAQEEYDAAMAGGTVAGYELRDGAFTDPTPPAPATGPVLGFPSPARVTERLEEAEQAARLAGEEAATDAFERRGAAASLGIARTAWLFGPPGRDFPHKILDAAAKARAEGQPLRVVDDEWGTPTYAADVADARSAAARIFVGKSLPGGP